MDIEQIRAAERGTAADTKSMIRGLFLGFFKLGLVIAGVAFVALMVIGAWSMLVEEDKTSAIRVQARMAIQEQLKDPDSAEFRNIMASETVVCGEVNAKNAFGGYVGFTRFFHTAGGITMLDEAQDKASFDMLWRTFCEPLSATKL